MKGFIEVKEKENGVRVLFQIKKIITISENKDGSAFIEFALDCNGESVGFHTCESYEHVVKQIKDFA